MNPNAFFEVLREAAGASGTLSAERQEDAWRVLPLEGAFEVVCDDPRGTWRTRSLDARAQSSARG